MSSERISRDHMLAKMAEAVAERSTCARLNVGAVLSRDGRVLSTGYNGAPSGMAHCSCSAGDTGPTPCPISVHAEANAIVFAAKHGVAIDGAELHITHNPCRSCALLIVNAGIRRLVFREAYRDTSALHGILIPAGVEVSRRIRGTIAANVF